MQPLLLGDGHAALAALPDPEKTPANSAVRYGEITEQNLAAHVMRRLTYNPDFDALVGEILAFIDGLRLVRPAAARAQAGGMKIGGRPGRAARWFGQSLSGRMIGCGRLARGSACRPWPAEGQP